MTRLCINSLCLPWTEASPSRRWSQQRPLCELPAPRLHLFPRSVRALLEAVSQLSWLWPPLH